MTGRERILAVLDRKPVDAIPYDLGGTDCSSVHVLPYQQLRRHFGLQTGPITCGCLIQLIAELEPEMRDLLEVDAVPLSFGARETRLWRTPFGVTLEVPATFRVEEQADGSCVSLNARGQVNARMSAGACYFDPAGTPLAGVTGAAELSAFDELFERWDYSPVYDEPLADLAERARRHYAGTERAVVALWRMHYLQSGQILRGYEQFLMDLMQEKALAHALLEKLHAVYLKRVDAFLGAFGDAVDVVFLTDDLGTQESGLLSPALYREMIFPYTAELVGRIKRAGKRVVMHACGAVRAFIPSLIEMGVDGLNPVQVSAVGMNPAELVREFGRDIAFWGGGCDTQHALNSVDPARVKADVWRRLDEFGESAHLIFTQVHNIQYDVPARNILAMREAFLERAR